MSCLLFLWEENNFDSEASAPGPCFGEDNNKVSPS